MIYDCFLLPLSVALKGTPSSGVGPVNLGEEALLNRGNSQNGKQLMNAAISTPAAGEINPSFLKGDLGG